MRSLALLLLLANLVFLTWQLSLLPWLPWQPSQFVKTVLPPKLPASTVPTLVLLSETTTKATVATPAKNSVGPKKGSSSNTSKTAVSSHSETANVVITKTKNDDNIKALPEIKEQPSDKAISQAVPKTDEQANKAIPNSQNDPAIGTPTTTEQVASTNKVVTSPNQLEDKVKAPVAVPADIRTVMSLPAPVENIRATNDQAPKAELKPIPVIQSPKTPKRTTTCFRAGPYLQAQEAKKAVDWLNRQVEVNAAVQTRDTPVATATKVYLAVENRQVARQVAQRLVPLGIHAVIESNNVMSLGLFKNLDNVTRLVKDLQAKGYHNVKTDRHYENATNYWLSIKIHSEPKAVLEAFSKKLKGPTLESVVCE